jgi:hypothetical protein
MNELLAKLKELEIKATPAPWKFERHPDPGTANYQEDWSDSITYRILPPDYDGIITVCDDERYYNSAPSIEDAELMAAMRNSLPKLLVALEAAKRFVDYCEDRFTWSAGDHEWEYMTDERMLQEIKDALTTFGDK